MSNDTQVAAHMALVDEYARVYGWMVSHRMARAKVKASARQLAEQPGLFEWLKTREADSYSCSLLVRDALARLTASPTAPSTEASEPVGEREANLCKARDQATSLLRHYGGSPEVTDKLRVLIAAFDKEIDAARTPPPPAPVPARVEYATLLTPENLRAWGHPPIIPAPIDLDETEVLRRIEAVGISDDRARGVWQAARTTPPPAPVLSDEEIINATDEIDTKSNGFVIRIARAIEAAHGITKERSNG